MKQIYIIEDGQGHKKIGMSGNIKNRLSQLKTGIPSGITSVMVSDFIENAREIESKLHKANKEYQINGEWFKEIIDFCDIDFSYIFMDVADGSIIIYQDFLEMVATDKDMTGKTIQVLFYMLGELEHENYMHTKQVHIAQELDIQKSHVSRAIRVLVNKGIILKVKDGTATAYKLNATYGWKGRVSNLQKEIKKQPVVDLKEYRHSTKNNPID